MNVLQFLLKIDNVLTDDVCDELITLFEESKHKERLRSDGYPNWTNLYLETYHPEVHTRFKDMYRDIAHKYQEWVGEYRNYFNTDAKHSYFEETNIKKYVGGSDDVYKTHADGSSFDVCDRFLAFLFYLNDDFEGGETIFYPEYVIKPKKGSVLIFPPYWMFPHEGTPVITGEKYIMSTYCCWKDEIAN